MPERRNFASLDAEGSVTPAGGVVTSRNGELAISLGARALPATRTLVVRDRPHPELTRKGGSGVRPLVAFDVQLKDASGREMSGQLEQEATITLDYNKLPLGDIMPQSLTFFTLDETTGRWQEIPSEVDVHGKKLTVRTRHFSGWAAGGDSTGGSVVPNVEVAQTTLFTRSADVAIELKPPPGLSDLVPKLVLKYSSNAINRVGRKGYAGFWSFFDVQASWVGIGWSLDPGYIMVRHADTGYEMYSMCLNGTVDRIMQRWDQQGSTLFHSQHENFTKIEKMSNPYHWVATTKDGTKYRFGYVVGEGEDALGDATNTGSRQDGVYFWSDGNPRVFCHRWFLDRIEDTHGNVVTIRYSGTRVFADGPSWDKYYDRSVYPREIVWNDRNSQPRWKIVFNRTEGRQDPVGSGINEYETAVLNNVEMYANSSDPYNGNSWQLVRRYVFSQTWVDYIDTRGDGRRHLRLDKIQEQGSDGSSTMPAWTFTYQSRYLRYYVDGQRWDQQLMPFLTEASNGCGGKVTFQYEDNENNIPSYGSGVRDDEKMLWHVLKTRKVYDGRKDQFGNVLYQQQDYSGTNPRFSTYETPDSPDFRGFNVVTVADGLNPNYKHEHRFLQGDDLVGGVTRQRSDGSNVTDSEGLVGQEYEARWLDGTTELRRVWTDYLQDAWGGWMPNNPPGQAPDNHIYFSVPNNIRLWQGSGSSRKAYTYENTYGNWTDMWEYASASDANWYRHTRRGFATYPNTTDWIVDKPNFVNLYAWDGSYHGAWKASTAYYYSGNSCLPPNSPSMYGYDQTIQKPADLRVVRRQWDDNGTITEADTFYEYDSYGNKVKEEVARTWGTYTTWGSDKVSTQWKDEDGLLGYDKLFRTFPKHVDNALGQRTTYVYDPRWGEPTSITDPNGQATVHAYDALGRKIATWLPGDDSSQPGAATITYRYLIGANSPTRIQIGRRKDSGGGSFGRRAYEWQFYDGLGRLIQTQTDFDRSGQVIRAQDVNEIRTALVNYGKTPSFAAVTAGVDRIQATHFGELRSKIGLLWGDASLGSMPNWSSGIAPGGPSLGTAATPIFGSDLFDLRSWLNLYEISQARPLTNWTNTTGTVSIVNRSYNKQGLLEKESFPHSLTLKVPGQFAEGDWNSTANPAISYTYDGLGRQTAMTHPDGTAVSTSYSGWSTSVVDENSHKKVFTNDAFGRLVKVEEFSGTNPYTLVGTTTYEYDVNDHLTKVIDAQNNQTIIQYDALGRKREMWDPDMGHWSYAYDAPGNLTTQTDARGQTLTFEYDALGRLRYKKNGTTTLAEFVYDEVVGGYSKVGRRTTMSFGSNSAKSYYDGRGRVVRTDVTLDSRLYQIYTTYDDMDRVATVTYPNGEVVTYTYGDHRLPISLQSSVKDSIVGSATYNAQSKLFDITLGNSLLTSCRYWGIDYVDPYNLRRNYGMLYSIFAGSLQNLTYDYDPKGNVYSLSDTRNNETIWFGYDHLDRLISASAPLNESYSYDNIGRMTTRNTTGYDYTGTPHIHAPRYVAGNYYDYDTNGNIITAESRTYEYDGENRLVRLRENGTEIRSFAYDGDGALRTVVQSGQTIHCVTPDYRVNLTSGEATVYYRFGGRAAAWCNNSALRYVLSDHLSSTHGEVGENQSEIGQRRYLPFGSDRPVNGASDIADDERFTSQRRIDAGDGNTRRELYHYGARCNASLID